MTENFLSNGMELHQDVFMKCLIYITNGVRHSSAENKYRAETFNLFRPKNIYGQK